MYNQFSKNFKVLRKVHELTQEQVAEMLGVSAQAISKWECGVSYPDIEVLPIISNAFNVSIDYLLGIDIAKQEKDIAEIINKSIELCNSDKYNEAVALLRNALVQYPSSCDIMYHLAWSLRGTIKEFPENEIEAINIYKRILNVSKNSELLCKSTRDLAYCYYTLGDIKIARSYIEMLPPFEVCREYNLGRSNVLIGKELSEYLLNNIKIYALAIKECLEFFVDEKILKEEEKLPYSKEKALKDIELLETILQ